MNVLAEFIKATVLKNDDSFSIYKGRNYEFQKYCFQREAIHNKIFVMLPGKCVLYIINIIMTVYYAKKYSPVRLCRIYPVESGYSGVAVQELYFFIPQQSFYTDYIYNTHFPDIL